MSWKRRERESDRIWWRFVLNGIKDEIDVTWRSSSICTQKRVINISSSCQFVCTLRRRPPRKTGTSSISRSHSVLWYSRHDTLQIIHQFFLCSGVSLKSPCQTLKNWIWSLYFNLLNQLFHLLQQSFDVAQTFWCVNYNSDVNWSKATEKPYFAFFRTFVRLEKVTRVKTSLLFSEQLWESQENLLCDTHSESSWKASLESCSKCQRRKTKCLHVSKCHDCSMTKFRSLEIKSIDE